VSTLALMRWLESAPERYDTGMRVLTLGRAGCAQRVVVEQALRRGGRHVLEIGCGTGALTALLVEHGAEVTAIDQNAAMLEQARRRLATIRVGEHAELLERTAAEIDAFPPDQFDAVVATFALSEMSATERRYVMAAAHCCLRPGGVLAIADEVQPRRRSARIVHALLRGPQTLVGWVLAGSVSRPIPDLTGELRAAGFEIAFEQRWLGGSLAAVVGERPRQNREPTDG